jgi:hypothetical protein
MGPKFFETGYGRKFYSSDLPRLIAALEKIADALAAIAARPPSDPKAKG